MTKQHPPIISMTSETYFQHIINRVQADIDFLVSQGALSQNDGRTISLKLSAARSSSPTVSTTPGPAAIPAPYTPPTTAPPPAPSRVAPPLLPRSSAPRARALWGYNENGQVCLYCCVITFALTGYIFVGSGRFILLSRRNY